MDVSPRHPFYVTIGSFWHKAQHLPKHVLVAHPEPAPPASHCQKNFANPVAIATSEERESCASSTKAVIPNSNEPIGAVHYKALIDKAKQIEQDADVQDKEMIRLLHGWHQKTGISGKYGSHHKQFNNRLSDVQHM